MIVNHKFITVKWQLRAMRWECDCACAHDVREQRPQWTSRRRPGAQLQLQLQLRCWCCHTDSEISVARRLLEVWRWTVTQTDSQTDGQIEEGVGPSPCWVHDVIYFTLLHIPIATVSGYVRCAHVALAMLLSMLAYLRKCRRKGGVGRQQRHQQRQRRSRRCKSRLDQCAHCALAIQRNW